MIDDSFNRSMVSAMPEQSDSRDAILSAAMTRILHYGYGKTTMAEIAKDCDMSAGNIYRFFKSKLDIAEAMARKFNQTIFQAFSEIVRRSDESALDRLREFFQSRLDRTYHLLEEDPKKLELAEVLGSERPGFANEQFAQERIYIVELLEQGIERGEIAPLDNCNFTAEMLQTALMKFEYPQLWTQLSMEKLQREFDGVMDLLIKALKA